MFPSWKHPVVLFQYPSVFQARQVLEHVTQRDNQAGQDRRAQLQAAESSGGMIYISANAVHFQFV